MPLVTVLMPTYNAEAYLDEAIDSILSQSFSDFEFLIINDGSNDSSLDIIKSYQLTDNRIKLISRENEGLVRTLNQGVMAAKGRYIVRMDADDISISNRLEKLINFMDSHPEVDIAGSFVEGFGDGIKTSVWEFPSDHKAMRVRTIFTVPLCHGSAIFKSQLFKEYGLRFDKDFPHAEDYELFSRVASEVKFGMLPEVLYKVRYVQSSVSRNADREHKSRKKILSNIFLRTTQNLQLELTSGEKHLHYLLTTSERMQAQPLNVNEVRLYLLKLLDANKKTNWFDQCFFKAFITRKYFTVLYYQLLRHGIVSLRCFFSSLFFEGFWGVLMRKKV